VEMCYATHWYQNLKNKKHMTYEDFKKEQSEMTDHELIEEISKQISKLCKTGGGSFTMSSPVRIDDTDILFCELLNRFKNTKNK